jgi:hypothetical protein
VPLAVSQRQERPASTTYDWMTTARTISEMQSGSIPPLKGLCRGTRWAAVESGRCGCASVGLRCLSLAPLTPRRLRRAFQENYVVSRMCPDSDVDTIDYGRSQGTARY